MSETETWYEIEVSHAGANDWLSTNDSADSKKSILEKLAGCGQKGFDFRAVEKVLTTTPVPASASVEVVENGD